MKHKLSEPIVNLHSIFKENTWKQKSWLIDDKTRYDNSIPIERIDS